MAVVLRDRFDRFVRSLYGSAPAGEAGSAALPTTIAETVRAIDPRCLQSLAHSTLATQPFLLALEEAQLPETSLRYALVHDEIGPAAFVLFTVVQLDLEGLAAGASEKRDGRRVRLLRRAGKTLQAAGGMERMVVGGHPLFWGSDFFAFRDRQPSPSLLATVVRAGYRLRKIEAIKVSLLKDFTAADLPVLGPLSRYGYVPFETQPNMVLRIQPGWRKFESYLAALAPRYRKMVRERRKAFEAGGLTLERARPTPIAAELAELYANVSARAATRWVKLTPSFFRAVEDHLRDAFRLWVVRKDQRIVAFVCALHDRLPLKGRNRLLGLFLGLDYGLNDEFKIYWNLLYKLVEEATDEGFETLDLGRTALQAKAELGAQPEPLHCFIRHRNPSANALVRLLFDQLVEPARAPERHALR